MKMISWNVNGIRACVGKNFMDFFKEADADIFCIQESKMQEGQLQLSFRVIINIGIMQKKRDIPELLFSQRKSRCQWHMESV